MRKSDSVGALESPGTFKSNLKRVLSIVLIPGCALYDLGNENGRLEARGVKLGPYEKIYPFIGALMIESAKVFYLYQALSGLIK